MINRGDLIDSLDLNIGYETMQKLKDNWGKKLNKKQSEADFERDDVEGTNNLDGTAAHSKAVPHNHQNRIGLQ